ncbi:MAG: nickel pincer cofactor biosynthesis protein LarC [Bacillota bacterium]
MKIAYLDCISGISGDMILGALVDAGLDPRVLRQGLARLPILIDIEIERASKRGIMATKVRVVIVEEQHEKEQHGAATVEGQHAERHHKGSHGRRLPDILHIIQESTLPGLVKRDAERIFLELARAEGRIHGIAPEEVHFHEVGGLDAIADIVGAAIGFQALGLEEIWCSPLPFNHGEVKTEHGLLPLPAPAALELLKGFYTHPSACQKELVTPTGAAIVASLARPSRTCPPMEITAIGYGAGDMDLPTPNVLRLIVGEGLPKERLPEEEIPHEGGPFGLKREMASVVEANIDDMNPEFYGYVTERLFELGALDVTLTPIYMKKGRPGVTLSAICADALVPQVAELITKETTTLGVRVHRAVRWVASRDVVTINTPYGKIRVKRAFLGETPVNLAPEYEDCREAAKSHNVPLKEVYEAARAAAIRESRLAPSP